MLTMKDVIREGDERLRTRSIEVPIPPTEEDLALLDEMETFLVNSQDPEMSEKYELRGGVGIAAPQLGVTRRFFTVLLQEEEETFKLSIFNPKITSHSVEQTFLNGGEGCLSVDRVVKGNVPRFRRITLEGFDRDGQPIKLRLRGMRAIVCQHELDHLDGILFYDRINTSNPLDTYGEPI
ncbi:MULTISPECIES: peptide deformylase [unclassified Exiguobacterium]|uniref:peptide deformylase n=1 Tax=unclassified Exiguobacterium TaxID=2644629 RepID=UPI001BE6BB5E|nr:MULTISPECIES: peptide deformylase [unclassified Exiguobacterium]MDA5560168.1 peptide deformylase [Exiguobacterium sp. MMG028]